MGLSAMKIITTAIGYILVIILSVFSSTAQATSYDIYVSNNYTIATCTFAVGHCPSIRAAIDMLSSNTSISTVGSVVYLSPGYYAGYNNTNICLDAIGTAASPRCLELSDIHISGVGSDASAVVIQGGGDSSTTDAIAIYASNNIFASISNITFRDFHRSRSTVASGDDGTMEAGALEIYLSTMKLNNLYFYNNSGEGGGAVRVRESNVSLASSEFFSNSAKLHGGAVAFVQSNAELTNCTFRGNNVTTNPSDLAGTGGAINFLGVNDMAITSCSFLHNRAERAGGAIFMDLDDDNILGSSFGVFSASGSTFSGNIVTGEGSCFSSSTCNSRGGAVYLSVINAAVDSCMFTSNRAKTFSTSEYAQGGAVFSTSATLDVLTNEMGLSIDNSTFTSNRATGQGGGVYVLGQRLQLHRSEFRSNYVDTVNSYFTDMPAQGGALWISTGNVVVKQSSIVDCRFVTNSAFSGWGGSVFGTDSIYGGLSVTKTDFEGNTAYSSYTNSGLGGAMMIASTFSLYLDDCKFQNNSAIPYLQLLPLTYSGSGGALFAQTAALNITDCEFKFNRALTGQFDSGAAGGALVLEDCYPAQIKHSYFVQNGAAGYYGYSFFASPGTGGGVYVKFSAAEFEKCEFEGNWVSAGGNEASVGGAVAVFFEYSSVSNIPAGVGFYHCHFKENKAYGELCFLPSQAGQGGGLAIVGANYPAVVLHHTNFSSNVATTAFKIGTATTASLGGGLSLVLSSNVTMEKSFFLENTAINGAGHDLSSISGISREENFIHATDCSFTAATKQTELLLLQASVAYALDICALLAHFVLEAEDTVISDTVTTSTAYAYADTSSSLFPISSSWGQHLPKLQLRIDNSKLTPREHYVSSKQQQQQMDPSKEEEEEEEDVSLALMQKWYSAYFEAFVRGTGSVEAESLTDEEKGEETFISKVLDQFSSSPALQEQYDRLQHLLREFLRMDLRRYEALGSSRTSLSEDEIQDVDRFIEQRTKLSVAATFTDELLLLNIPTSHQLQMRLQQESDHPIGRSRYAALASDSTASLSPVPGRYRAEVSERKRRRHKKSAETEDVYIKGSQVQGGAPNVLEKEKDKVDAETTRSLPYQSLHEAQEQLELKYRMEVCVEVYALLRAAQRSEAREVDANVDADVYMEADAATGTAAAAAATARTAQASTSSAEDEYSTASPSNALATLVSFHPSVVITSGRAYFENPAFNGRYHMFFGDFPEIAQYTYSVDVVTTEIVTVPSYSAMFGHITQENLTITALSASIEIFDSNDNENYTISQLHLFNATMHLNRNVTVTGASLVTDSEITSIGNTSRSLLPYVEYGVSRPYVTFSNNLYTGVSLSTVFAQTASTIPSPSRQLNESLLQTLFTIDSVVLVVQGLLVSDSPSTDVGNFRLLSVPSSLGSSARFKLNNDAVILVEASGTFGLLTETYVEAASDASPAVINYGNVALYGRTKRPQFNSSALQRAPASEAASLGSLASRCAVRGRFDLMPSGSITVYLNRTKQNSPVMFLIDSQNFSGSVRLNFYTDEAASIYPDLLLYDGATPSKWQVIAYRDRYSNDRALSFDTLALEAHSGLLFSQSSGEYEVYSEDGGAVVEDVSSNAASDFFHSSATSAVALSSNSTTLVYTWDVQIQSIGCPLINNYYFGVPQQDALQATAPNEYNCFVCLQNSTCNLCGSGQCAVAGECSKVAYSDTCCKGGCNGRYGVCEVNADRTSFSCNCDATIWYVNPKCEQLSAIAYVIIFSSISLFLTLVTIGFFYWRSLQQKRLVLDELADGLLNHNAADGTINNEYIQYMQQALILNDVFVEWSEIKLESVVGEGSFGVVHKATFRGAQVAVKQMRSMFSVLTDKEIDEFRKEAYVMSRLRHPNIVLVMGISLVDQEPLPLPKSRSANFSADDYDSMYPSNNSNEKKAAPQKTVCIITEFLEQGSLADILYGPTKLPDEVWTYELVLTCALQAARGMLYLHSHQPPICHRDLKSSNLVVDDHWVVKVTDFGMSRIVPESIQNREKGLLSPNPSSSTSGGGGASGFMRTLSSAGGGFRRQMSGGGGNAGGGGMASGSGRKFSLAWRTPSSQELQRQQQQQQQQPPKTSPQVEEEEGVTGGERDSGMDPNDPAFGGALDATAAQGVGGAGAEGVKSGINAGAIVAPVDISAARPLTMTGIGTNRLSQFNPEMTSNLGTTAWCAPEVLVSGMKTRYTVKVDVYSFGLVLWELWERKRPFEELTSRFDIMDAVRAGQRPEISPNCPPSFRSLIQRCWQHEPSRRPMFKYIVRYLKDELARVKRQKSLLQQGHDPSTSGIRLTVFNLMGQQQSPHNDGDGAGGAAGSDYYDGEGGGPTGSRQSFTAGGMGEAAADFIRRSFTAARASFSSHHSSNTSAPSGAAAVAASGGVASAAGSRDSSMRNVVRGSESVANSSSVSPQSAPAAPAAAAAAAAAGHRSPLVNAVQGERSLSYLTESPSLMSQQPAVIAGGGGGGGGGGMPSRPSIGGANPMNNPNRWRDKYVLQFSGWQSSQPDTGLPPSLSHTNNRGSSAALPPQGASFLMPAPAAAVGGSADDGSASAASEVETTSFNPMLSGVESSPGGRGHSGSLGSRNSGSNSNANSSKNAGDGVFTLDADEEQNL